MTDRRQTLMVGYVRVSTGEQARSGLGLAAQEQAIRRECKHRGWELAELVRDEGLSGSSLERPGLRKALRLIARGGADGLIVAKLDRLSRSVIDFGLVLEWFKDAGASFVALDLGVDTSTPGGRLVANVFASVAEWERDTIAQRTRDALAELRAQGKPTGPPTVSSELAERIRAMQRDEGMSLRAICTRLNDQGVPTPRGGAEWRPSSLQAALGYRRRPQKRRRTQLPRVDRP